MGDSILRRSCLTARHGRRRDAAKSCKIKNDSWRLHLMKNFLLGTVALIALGATVPALAADMAARPYTKAPPAVYAPIYNWTGFYIGGHVGGAFGGSDNILAPGFTGTNSNDGVFMGGVQVGYDHQFAPNWV